MKNLCLNVLTRVSVSAFVRFGEDFITQNVYGVFMLDYGFDADYIILNKAQSFESFCLEVLYNSACSADINWLTNLKDYSL